MSTRRALSAKVTIQVLTEAGYRCAVPTCRAILAIDIHHIIPVSEGGPNHLSNLLALCPTCHALLHRGVIAPEALFAWKSMLVTLNQAFDQHAIDDLLFLASLSPGVLPVSADGVLPFRRLIAAGLATFQMTSRNGPFHYFDVLVSSKGRSVVRAWRDGDRAELAKALAAPPEHT